MSKGVFTVIEGIDACGKSTQVALLKQYIENLDESVVVLHYPNYNGPTGKLIGEFLRGETDLGTYQWGGLVTHPDRNLALQSLFAIDRYEHTEYVQGLLASGTHVLCDRYWYSSFAYGTAQGIPGDWIQAINHAQVVPDLAILLDITAAESLQRRPVREDAFETDTKLLAGASLAYRELFRTDIARDVYAFDGLTPVPDLAKLIANRFCETLKEKLHAH